MSLGFFLVPLLLFLRVSAQTSELFQWAFSNNFLSTSLPSCQNFSITVKPYNPANDTTGLFHAPFYMIAFEVGGTPRTTLLGVENDNLNWLVDHPVGTQLLLSVVDANGSAGGIPPQLYQVVTGQSTSCIQTSTSSDFTVKANVTDTLTTCQPWRLSISGGVPPYNLTLAALNSPNVTNVTLLGTDDAFTYIDRANPDTQLIAGISDLTGRWASGTPIVHTQGSSDVDCVGLVSSSGNATQLQQEDDAAAAAAAAERKRTTSIIAGVCVTLGVLLLGAGGFVTVLYLRRRKARLQALAAKEQLDLSIKPFEEVAPSPTTGEGRVLSINSWINNGPATPRDAKFGVTRALSYNADQSAGESSSRPTSSSSSRPGFANFPVRSVKSLEAAGLRSDNAGSISSPPSSGDSTRPLMGSVGGEEESGAVREYVIQHRDGGDTVVRELPPPYADRTGTGGSSDNT